MAATRTTVAMRSGPTPWQWDHQATAQKAQAPEAAQLAATSAAQAQHTLASAAQSTPAIRPDLFLWFSPLSWPAKQSQLVQD
ncbi:hypothetical protein EV1_017746 [Malus domestica]